MNAIPLTVTRVGFRATFTDLGRRNAEISGVPTGGAADQHSAVVANILAGNARDGVLIEAIGDFGLVARRPLLVAVTGAPAAVTINGSPAEPWTTLVVPPGHEIAVTGARQGLRTYVAVGGELSAPRFMGSAAPDPRMGFAQLVRRGDVLTLRRPSALPGLRAMDAHPFHFQVPRLELPEGPWTLDVVPAAEHDCVPDARTVLAESTYTVKPQSDHVGVRLAGPVRHPERAEIVSHGVPIGAVEIPHADDELIVLGRYRTLTAGYPIVGVVARVDLALVGQLSAGRAVRFRWVTRQRAVERAAQHAAELAALERSVTAAFGAVVGQLGADWWL